MGNDRHTCRSAQQKTTAALQSRGSLFGGQARGKVSDQLARILGPELPNRNFRAAASFREANGPNSDLGHRPSQIGVRTFEPPLVHSSSPPASPGKTGPAFDRYWAARPSEDVAGAGISPTPSAVSAG